MKSRNGFTLIEMLVVIGIIVTLMGASIAGYSAMMGSAEETKTHELVSNVATALMAIYQREGYWPKRLVEGASGENLLDENAALPLAKKNYLSLAIEDGKLVGFDKFGVLSPQGVAIMKRKGSKVTKEEVKDYILKYAIDEDGDGITEHPDGLRIRATACVWCDSPKKKSAGKKAKVESWTKGQVVQ